MLKKRLVLVIIIFSILLPNLSSSVSSDDENPWWHDSWSFRQEINIPFDTKNENAKFQPIDINFRFENQCWAENTKTNSIRIIYQDGGVFRELESQIYDLNFTDEKIITSCSIVFLIPKYSNGEEKYYVYYDESKKNPTIYDDHVSIEDTYYKYEPVAGISYNTWYYAIFQEDYLEYALIKKGNALGNTLSQQVTKLKEKSLDILPKNGKHSTSFCLNYWYGTNGDTNLISSSEKLVFGDILVDGNLMVKCIIISSSNNDLIKTTNVYKYYYCPNKENSRVHVNVNHEIKGDEIPKGEEVTISFGEISLGGVKSNIEELNSGGIPPFLHFYGENERVITYELDTSPEGIDWQELISNKDDYDVGSFSWISTDYGKKGEAQGLILDSNKVIKSDEDEPDGVQIQLYESNRIQLPNINGKFAKIYLMRNSFEPGKEPDDILPKDYTVSYSADFFSTDKGGYEKVSDEALIFQKSIKYKPVDEKEYDETEKDKDIYNLKVYIDLSRSLTRKYRLSTILLRNTYIVAELFKDGRSIGLSRVGRITLTEDYWIDWNNISIYKKASFKNLEKGTYLVKIYIKNLFFKNTKNYVGYQIIDLNDNLSTKIYCSKEGLINLDIYDQYNVPIKNAELRILDENVVIYKEKIDDNGYLCCGIPCDISRTYKIQILYKGFLIKEEEIKFGLIRSLIPLNYEVNVELFNYFVKVDKHDDFDFDLSLYSNEMFEETIISPDKVNGEFVFNNVVGSGYFLQIKYNDFFVEEKISIEKNSSFSIDLKDISIDIIDKWNLTPDAHIDIWLSTDSFKKNIVLSGEKNDENTYFFKNLYPGTYEIKLTYKKDLYKKNIKINGNKNNYSIVFPEEYNLSTKIYDLHGNLINDVKIDLIRDNRSITKNSTFGKIKFSVPPGEYICLIYNEDSIISKRKIDVLYNQDLKIVSNKDSSIFYYLFLGFLPVLFAFGVFLIKKEKIFLFLKIIVLFLVISSLIFPWWNLSEAEEKSDVNTDTSLYVAPAKMITVTSYDSYVSGEFASLDEDFASTIDFIPYLIFGGVIFLFINIFLKQFSFARFSSVFLIISTLFFISSISVFYIAMSIFSESLVGSLFGSNMIKINLIGTSTFKEVLCNWGVYIGFYFVLISSIILSIYLINIIIKIIKKKVKIIYLK